MKMARVLVGGDLAEEAREPLSAAILSLGRALAAEQRLVEPRTGICGTGASAGLSLGNAPFSAS